MNNKQKLILIKNVVLDISIYEISFDCYCPEERISIKLANNISVNSYEFFFKKNDFNDMKEYDIIKENILNILKPLDIGKKLITDNKSNDDYLNNKMD